MTALKILLVFLLIPILAHCQSSNSSAKIITVQPASTEAVLYFEGSIQPIKTYLITTPIEGYIKKRFFYPGTAVAKNQLLLVISSEKMRETYRDTLIAYIKATRDYDNDQAEMSGIEALNKHGIISQEEYLSAKAKSQDIHFEYQQAVSKLTEILKKLQIPLSIIGKINANQLDAILPTASLSIRIFSPATGIAYVASDNTNNAASSPNDRAALSPGSVVRQDNPLIKILDMSGITVPIQVNELQIDDIQEGAQASITGDAFRDFILNGRVHIKQREATETYNGSFIEGGVNYTVYVDVAELSLAQQAVLRIGMSATVRIPIKRSAAVASIPLTALYQKANQSYVKRLNPQSKQTEEVAVKVGRTGFEDIEILEGLKPGDHIVDEPSRY